MVRLTHLVFLIIRLQMYSVQNELENGVFLFRCRSLLPASLLGGCLSHPSRPFHLHDHKGIVTIDSRRAEILPLILLG